MDSSADWSGSFSSRHAEDLTTVLHETQTAAIQCAEKGDFAEALQLLQKNEAMLEEAKRKRLDVDPDYILATLHNLAYCHQQLASPDLSASYLEACLYNLSQSPPSPHKPSDLFKRKKYECRGHIQLCALLSNLKRHEGALTHARISVKLSHSLLSDAMNLCFEHMNRHKKMLAGGRGRGELGNKLESVKYKHGHELVKKAYPVLQLMEARVSERQVPVNAVPIKLEMRSILGVQHYDDWIYTFNVGDMVQMQVLTIFELKSSVETFAELTRDAMLDKICLQIIGYYCLSTELRLLYSKEKLSQAHDFHLKALQIAKDLLPIESPLLEHLRASYQRLFSAFLDLKAKATKKTTENRD